VRFVKAHGLGNSFLLVDRAVAPADRPAWARRLCDVGTGVGADGVVVYDAAQAAATFRLLNADGSDAEMSGNGLRCLAALLVERGLRPERHRIETVVGPRGVAVERIGGARYRVEADLGSPVLASPAIPVALEPARDPVVDHTLSVAGRSLRVTATSLGNPHCAVFVDQPPDDALLASLGPALERHPFFPHRTNVEFVNVLASDALQVRMWERGVGPTRSSGTGAASAVVAAVLTGRAGRRVRVACDGGHLDVEWPAGGSVRQTGEVELLVDGDWITKA